MFFHVFRLMVQGSLTYWLHSLMFFHVFRLMVQGSLTYWLHSLIFFHVFWLMVQGFIDLLASFFDILSCILIDGPRDHWLIGFILWYSFMYFDCWSRGPLTYWLHSLIFFYVFWLMVQGSIDLLASFFDVLSCISFDGPVVHLTYWLHSLIFFQVFLVMVYCPLTFWLAFIDVLSCVPSLSEVWCVILGFSFKAAEKLIHSSVYKRRCFSIKSFKTSHLYLDKLLLRTT